MEIVISILLMNFHLIDLNGLILTTIVLEIIKIQMMIMMVSKILKREVETQIMTGFQILKTRIAMEMDVLMQEKQVSLILIRMEQQVAESLKLIITERYHQVQDTQKLQIMILMEYQISQNQAHSFLKQLKSLIIRQGL